MAALVAALLIRATDRSTGYVATVAERSGRTGAVLLGIVLALLVTQSIAAIAGAMVAPHLTLNAQRLMVALALLSAGFGAIWRGKELKRNAGRRPLIGVAATLISAGLTDSTQFTTFAIAAGGIAGLAAAGGVIGSVVVLGAAALAGAQVWSGLPDRPARYVIGGILLAVGAWLAVSALRLI